MFCRTCGNETVENAEFCVNCGKKPNNGNAHCYNCGSNTNPEQVVCVKCGVNLENAIISQIENNNPTKFCKGCGHQLNEMAEICINCGIKPENGNSFCQNCGSETNSEQEICTNCGVRVNHSNKIASNNSSYTNKSFTSYNEYYTNEFAGFEASNEQYQGKFNWAAFFFGPLWLLYKGMWQLGLILLGLSCFITIDVFIIDLIVGILLARKANYLYYRKEKFGEQLPKDWKIFIDFMK